MYDREELREIQQSKFRILKNVVAFCEENQLVYWLDSGTLLGAVRHKGFIPWDDDIDIAMLEKDAIFLKENYKSQDFEIMDTAAEELNFYKVVSKKEEVQMEEATMNVDIDIFPIAYYPNSLEIKFWNSFFHLRKNKIDSFSIPLFLKNFGINLKRKFKKTKLFHYKNIEKKIKNICEKKVKKCDFLAYTYNCGFHLHFWEREEIFPLRKLEFEGVWLNAPNQYDSYLKKIYYRYMDLPPKKRRVPDHYRGRNLRLVQKSEKENVEKDTIKTILEKKVSIPKTEIKKIDCLGGMTNANFLVEKKEEKYVFRLPGEGCSYFINRKNENYNIHAIQSLQLDAEIVYFDENTGIKITKYLEGAKTLNPDIAFHYKEKVAEALRLLHSSGAIFLNHFDVFHEILHYENGIQGNISEKYFQYDLIREKIFNFQRRLKKMGQKLVSCHNDTVPENFIFSQERIRLIDWEYSGMNEVEWDLGAFCLECSFSKEEEEKFIQSYFQEKVTDENRLKIKIYQICQDFLWSLWTIMKEERGENFGNYGLDRYQRCVRLLKELEENECKK